MAIIGMRHVVAAPLSAESGSADPTYGTGLVVGKAIQGNVSWDRADNPLYADDVLAESDNAVTGGTVEIGVDDLENAARVTLLGAVKLGSTGDIYETTDDAAPYVGVGYIRVRRKGGVTSFQGIWYYKVQFSESNENTNTKGQNIEWQTPTLSGKILGIKNDSSGKYKFRRFGQFATEAAALEWLNGLAHIAQG